MADRKVQYENSNVKKENVDSFSLGNYSAIPFLYDNYCVIPFP